MTFFIKLGVIEKDTVADMILVDRDPVANLELVADPDKNFKLIMKVGIIYKDTLQCMTARTDVKLAFPAAVFEARRSRASLASHSALMRSVMRRMEATAAA